MWCFAHFEVDLEQRQLRRAGEVVPLQEKPFKLLEALLAHPGDVVSRDELYRALWADAEHLDFDASLNVAARKLRQALGDTTDAPRWLETVPRLGYRLQARVVGKPAVEAASGPRRIAHWAAVSLAMAGLVALFWLVSARMQYPQQRLASGPVTIRLAIMPFELAAGSDPLRPDLAPISEWLVAELAAADRLDVIGPRSTAKYEAKPFPDLSRLADELAADYVLNARTVEAAQANALLVELIRLSDGAHPWVEFFEEVDDWRAVAETIRGHVGSVLGLG